MWMMLYVLAWQFFSFWEVARHAGPDYDYLLPEIQTKRQRRLIIYYEFYKY